MRRRLIPGNAMSSVRVVPVMSVVPVVPTTPMTPVVSVVSAASVVPVVPVVPVVLAALAVLGGCGGEGGAENSGGGFAMPPTAVEVATVERAAVRDEFETVGSIEAGEIVTVVSEIDAAVKRLPFREGDPISRGALIAQLDDSELAAELARAVALEDQSRASWERVKLVVESDAAAPQDLDDAAAELKVAEANVALARARLAKTRIVAPFDGVAGARRVSPGAFLRTGTAITELAQIHEIKVAFSAPERYIARLKRGVPVSVSTTAYPGYELMGRIDVVHPVLDPATRTVRVTARVANPDLKLRPGMSADVKAVLAERSDALLIPSEAIFAEGDAFLVFVVGEDGSVTKTPVVLGTRFRDTVEIVGGLEPGDIVVRAGHQKLFPGAKVQAVNAAGSPGAGAPGGEGGGPPGGSDASSAAPEGGADVSIGPSGGVEGAPPGSAIASPGEERA